MVTKYAEKVKIYNHYTNYKGRLFVKTLCDLFNDAAEVQTELYKVDVDTLNAQGFTWMLHRLHILLHKMPLMEEIVTIETWPSGIDRLFALRDYRMFREDGEELVRATSECASASGQHVQLMPGQQASLGRQGGEIVVGEVNIQQVVDWKNGMFVFDDLSLEAILRKVARWYDVEVFYRNQQAKAIVFKGNLPRYGELPELLKVLENSSEVHFSLKGNTLIVE